MSSGQASVREEAWGSTSRALWFPPLIAASFAACTAACECQAEAGEEEGEKGKGRKKGKAKGAGRGSAAAVTKAKRESKLIPNLVFQVRQGLGAVLGLASPWKACSAAPSTARQLGCCALRGCSGVRPRSRKPACCACAPPSTGTNPQQGFT